MTLLVVNIQIADDYATSLLLNWSYSEGVLLKEISLNLDNETRESVYIDWHIRNDFTNLLR